MINSILSKLKDSINKEFIFKNRKIIFAFVVIHIVVHLSIANITAFAVDEKVYLATFQSILDNDYVKGRYLGWPYAEKLTIQFLYLPAQFLVFIGTDPLNALRIQSTFLSLTSLLIMLHTFNRKSKRSSYLLWGVFFIPSMLLWTSLGLRESFIFLWLIMILTSVIKIQNLKVQLAPTLLFLGSMGLYLTKFHLYFILLVSFVTASLLFLIFRRGRDLKLFLIVILVSLPALIFLPSTIDDVTGLGKSYKAMQNLNYTNSPSNEQNSWEFDIWTAQGKGSVSAKTPKPILTGSSLGMPPIVSNGGQTIVSNGGQTIVSNGGQTLELLLGQIKNNNLTFFISKKIGLYDYLVQTQKSSLFPNTNPAIRDGILNRGTQIASLNDIHSIIRQSITFLFSPNPFRNNGTIFLELLSYEIVFWIILYSLFIWALFISILIARQWNSEKLNIFVPILSAIICIYFVGFSALTEVSIGNALRHRTVLVIPMVVSILYIRECLPRKNYFFSKTIV